MNYTAEQIQEQKIDPLPDHLDKRSLPSVAFCTKCNTNWARLYTLVVESDDEDYDCCPLCSSDTWLTDGRPGASYILPPDKVFPVDPITGKEKIPVHEVKSVTAKKTFDKEAYKQSMIEREQQEDERLQRYQELFETEGKETAEAYFFNK